MVERMTGSSVAMRQVAKSQPDSRLASVTASRPRKVLARAGVPGFLAGFLAGAFFDWGAEFFCGLSATWPPRRVLKCSIHASPVWHRGARSPVAQGCASVRVTRPARGPAGRTPRVR